MLASHAGLSAEGLQCTPCSQALTLSVIVDALCRNNAGGAWNHAFFFKCMAKPTAANASTNAPAADSPLSKAIDLTFGNFSTFKTNFSEAATKRFGSGFAWLVVNNSNKLAVFSTPNQVCASRLSTFIHVPVTVDGVWSEAGSQHAVLAHHA